MNRMTTRVPVHKIKQFQEILGACGGNFDHNPIGGNDYFNVTVSFEDGNKGNEFCRRWNRVKAEPVVEKTRKLSWYKRVWKCLTK